MSNTIALGLTGLIAAVTTLAQAPATPTSFEVASFRPHTLNDRIVTIHSVPAAGSQQRATSWSSGFNGHMA